MHIVVQWIFQYERTAPSKTIKKGRNEYILHKSLADNDIKTYTKITDKS